MQQHEYPSWESIAPNPSLLESVINVNVLSKSGYYSTGASQSFCFSVSNASCCLLVQWNGVSFFVRSVSGFCDFRKVAYKFSVVPNES